ncbi:MAG: hypothetical protein KAS32_00565 [Candidatus Peribacteraceae bacterium]|nr:hypothetical protein [Candidatus Peribacteraceae bacterium]
MGNDNKDYVKFLESAVSTQQHQNAPVSKILDWEGKGALPETLDSEELDAIVKRITKEDTDVSDADPKETAKAYGDEMPDDDDDVMDKDGKEEEGSPEMADLGESPLSLMDDITSTTNEDVDALLAETSFTDHESDLLKRLVLEMDAMDYSDDGDVFDDSEDVSGEIDGNDNDEDDD